LIVVANWLFVDIDLIADLERSSIPATLVGTALCRGSVNSVLVDNEVGGHMAIEHLWSLGHRKIAFIRGPKKLSDSVPRWKGVRSFAQAKNLGLDSRLILDLPESRDAISGFEAGAKLTEELIRRHRNFTAIMAFDDLTALGVIRGLTKAGIRVPEQCSVIGFDDVAPAALATPALTTVRQPMENMGTMAVNIVLEGINSVSEKRVTGAIHRRMAPELVVRESTRSL
jgi:DNA-binding LacI/PurR family transcriptional regulator